jgi:hypothetical protein
MSEINNFAIAVMTLLSASVCVCLPRLTAMVGGKLAARRSSRRSTPSRSYRHAAPSQVSHPEASPELSA